VITQACLVLEYSRERVRQPLHASRCRLRCRYYRRLTAKSEEPSAFRSELEVLLAEWPKDGGLIFVLVAIGSIGYDGMKGKQHFPPRFLLRHRIHD
jgi:hypothetical protein